jgi:predicted DNA-binding transcriptional regulator YafY
MQLIEKLEKLSSKYFKSHVKHIKTLPDTEIYNKQIFHTIEILDEAISNDRKVSFHYIGYGTDMKSHPKLGEDGKPKEYIISPYQMAAKDGKYYLICNYDKYNDISNYRIDRITDIKILDTKRKPFSKLKDANGDRFNLGDYMKTHIHMYSSGDTRVRFKIVPPMVGVMIDIFGKDVRFEEENDDHVIVSAKVTEAAMIQFAKAHAPDVVILEPQNMVDQMKEWAEKVKKVY